jgi:hypothetical protein
MAKQHDFNGFVGPVGPVSIYKMRGHDGLVMRTKGGANKKRIKNAPEFELTRKNNSEFGGCSKAGKWIRNDLHALRVVTDYNISGPLNAMMKHIQRLDTESDLGCRNVLLSRNPRLLEGFNFNKKSPFDTIIQNPVHYALSKDEVKATIDIPAIIPGLNFNVPGNFSQYRFIVILSSIPDFYYSTREYLFYDLNYPKEVVEAYEDALSYTKTYSDWYPVTNGSAAINFELQLEQKPPLSYSLMLAIGISFGVVRGNIIEPVQYVGGGKILGMA